MKYLNKFESIIIPSRTESDIVVNSFESAIEVGLKNDFDVVDYDTFYDSLSDLNKLSAPPRRGVPFFALFNPNINRIMFVICDQNAPRYIPNFKEVMLDIIGHEKIHQEQGNRRTKIGYRLPSPLQRKEYFSNKDEIMAFSYTIANDLYKKSNDLEDAIDILRTGHWPSKNLWNDIKRYCDYKIVNRYRKYIYLYLENMFNDSLNERKKLKMDDSRNIKDIIMNLKNIDNDKKIEAISLLKMYSSAGSSRINGLKLNNKLRKKISKYNLPSGFDMGIDSNGYFIHTHRARSKSHESSDKISVKEIRFIDSTG